MPLPGKSKLLSIDPKLNRSPPSISQKLKITTVGSVDEVIRAALIVPKN